MIKGCKVRKLPRGDGGRREKESFLPTFVKSNHIDIDMKIPTYQDAKGD